MIHSGKEQAVPLKRRCSGAPVADGDRRRQSRDSAAATTAAEVDMDDFRGIRLFNSLSGAELNAVRPRIICREYKKNQVILREEDANVYMYIILRGKVKIYRMTDDGREMILSIHAAGDFFGEMSLIDGKTTPATVGALEPTEVAIISRPDFYALLRTQQKILDNLLHILCARLREAWKKITMLNFHNASDRVKMLLIMVAQDLGEKTDRGTILRIKLIHQDIADMTGLTRETVTRVLDKWRKSGEIKILGNKHIQLNPEFETITL